MEELTKTDAPLSSTDRPPPLPLAQESRLDFREIELRVGSFTTPPPTHDD